MTVKKKSLFDHVNQITSVQNPNYWDEISDEDKKSWSNYMINRFLSMKSDWIDLVNEVQKPGRKFTLWDATNKLGQPVSAGTYIYTIQVGKFRQTKKMVLLK